MTATTDMSSTQISAGSDMSAGMAVDGNNATFTHTVVGGSDYPWWEVNMGAHYTVRHVEIVNCASNLNRLKDVIVTVDGLPCGPKLVKAEYNVVGISCPLRPHGTMLRIQLVKAFESGELDRGILSLSEVMIFGHE
eukprot:Ihof_evm1s1432 gene=Ihof_evmTU1s1432